MSTRRATKPRDFKLTMPSVPETVVQKQTLSLLGMQPWCRILKQKPVASKKRGMTEQQLKLRAEALKYNEEHLARLMEFLSDGKGPCKVIAWRQNTGAGKNPVGQFVRYGEPGTPDVCGIIHPGGAHLGLEIKRSDKVKPKPAQLFMGAVYNYCGAVHHVVSDARIAVLMVATDLALRTGEAIPVYGIPDKSQITPCAPGVVEQS